MEKKEDGIKDKQGAETKLPTLRIEVLPTNSVQPHDVLKTNVLDFSIEGDWLRVEFIDGGKVIKEFLNTKNVLRVVYESEGTGSVSDGHHTFDELYDFRMLYNASLFNTWYSLGKYEVKKSLRHFGESDPCFGGGWFVVTANLPSGQITNHYPEKYWEYFKCEEVENAPEWDGHTSEDVQNRLKNHILNNPL